MPNHGRPNQVRLRNTNRSLKTMNVKTSRRIPLIHLIHRNLRMALTYRISLLSILTSLLRQHPIPNLRMHLLLTFSMAKISKVVNSSPPKAYRRIMMLKTRARRHTRPTKRPRTIITRSPSTLTTIPTTLRLFISHPRVITMLLTLPILRRSHPTRPLTPALKMMIVSSLLTTIRAQKPSIPNEISLRMNNNATTNARNSLSPISILPIQTRRQLTNHLNRIRKNIILNRRTPPSDKRIASTVSNHIVLD